jgi:hypothetical protein
MSDKIVFAVTKSVPFLLLFINRSDMSYDTIFKLIGDVGFPIAAALLGGVFVYFVINYILESVVKAIKGMQGIIMGLDNRVKTMNHDIIRVDAVVSSALGLKPDLDRIARADGKNDARRD